MTANPDNVPLRELSDQDRQRGMQCAILCSIGAIIGASVVTGNFLNLVAIKLGAGELYLGILTFSVTGPIFFQVFTMSSIERLGKRKVMLTWMGISVLFMIPFVVLPSLVPHLSAWACLAILLSASFFRSVTANCGATGWFPFLQDIVPEEITGRFFARMRTWWQAAQLITMLALAWWIKDSDSTPDQWRKIQIIFFLGLLAYLFRVLAIVPAVEIPPTPLRNPPVPAWRRFREVLTDRKLLKLIMYIVFYMMASTATTPFKIKLLKNLHFSDEFILAVTAMVSLGAIVSLKSWGKLADRFGNRSIFSISHIGMIIATALWILVDQSLFSAVLVFVLFFLESVFNSGNGIAQTRYIFHAIPSDKQNHINVLNIIAIFASAVAPLLGGVFLHFTDHWRFRSGAVDLNHYHIFFLLIAGFFVVPHVLRRKLGSKKDTPTAQVITFITQSIRETIGPFARLGRKPEP